MTGDMLFTLKDLGDNIRTIRESLESRVKPGKSLLQYELAGMAGIPASSLSNIEKGKYRNPTWNILSKIARALDCEVSELFCHDRRKVSASQIAFDEIIDMIIRERLEKALQEKSKP